MTKIFFNKNLFICFIIFSTRDTYTHLTLDGFSDIRADVNSSFRHDFNAAEQRIAEEMCDGDIHQIPTCESILNFITTIQNYIDKIKNTQNITPETVEIARLAVFDVAKARKMLHHTTPADIQMDIRTAIQKVDMQVIELEKYIATQRKSNS